MSMIGSSGQLWKLTAGNNDQPTVTPGQTTKWDLNDVPDRCPSGPLAYYLPYVLLTIKGVLNNPTEGAVTIQRDVLPGLIIDSIDWVNAWHGSVVSKNHVLGKHLRVISFIAGGFRDAQRQTNDLVVPATGTKPFSLTIAIPASDRRRKFAKETAQLALLFQPSSFKLNMAPATVLAAFASGAGVTLTAANGQVSAKLDARSELVLGAGAEWILHQVVAGPNSPQVKIVGFGRDTNFTGVEAKGGLMHLAELTSVNGQGGVFAANTVTEFTFGWLGQQPITDIDAWVSQHLESQPNDRPQNSAQTPAGTASRTNDYSQFPYAYTTLDTLDQAIDRNDLLQFPIRTCGDETRLSEIQTGDKDETYFLQCNTPFSDGDHLILAEYARVWTEAKRADWLSKVLNGGKGDSLAAYVLGADKVGSATLGRRLPIDEHTLSPDEQTYLPWQLIAT